MASPARLILQRPQFADDTLEQRGLAGTVRSDDGDQTVTGNVAVQMVNRGMPVITEGQIVKADDRRWQAHDIAQPMVSQSSVRAARAHSRRVVALAHSAGLTRVRFSTGCGLGRVVMVGRAGLVENGNAARIVT